MKKMTYLNFLSKIDGGNIQLLDKSLIPESSTIEWECDFDFRSWGIKEITIKIKNIKIYSNTDSGVLVEYSYSEDCIVVDVTESNYPVFENLKPRKIIEEKHEQITVFF